MNDSFLVLAGLRAKRVRTISLIVLVALIAFVITGGTLLGFSLLTGIQSAADRLGADAMFVPISSVQETEGALLRGTPSTFYLSGEAAETMMHVDGIQRASPQIFIATFNSAHCAFPVQVIGYDPETDFVIAPWLSAAAPGGLKTGEIVVGNSVVRYEGQDMYAFGENYIVAGRLDKTGMGFDTSIFVNMETARKMIEDYKTFPEAEELPDDPGIVSAIILDLEPGVDPEAYRKYILSEYMDLRVGVVLPQAMIETLSNNLGLTLAILTALLSAIWALAVVVLTIVFSVMLNERKREFGTLRALGATRKRLSKIVLMESASVGIAGSAIGTAALCLVVFPFQRLIENSIEASLLLPSPGIAAAILAGGFLLCAAMGPLASLRLSVKIGKSDAFTVIREGM